MNDPRKYFYRKGAKGAKKTFNPFSYSRVSQEIRALRLSGEVGEGLHLLTHFNHHDLLGFA